MPGLLYGQGAVWVTGGKFMKIDPASNSIVAELKEASGCVAAVGEGYIWATKFGLKAHDLVRLAPQTGEVTARVRGLPHYRGSPAVGEGSVWLHVAGKVLRIDPKRAEVVATIPTHGSWGTIAFGAGAVWVLEQTHPWPNAESLLLRIDASSNQLTDTLHLGTGAGSIAVGEDAVWVAQWEQTSPREPMPGKLLRIEPRSLRIVRAIPLWSQPAHIVIAAGSVWVSSSEAILRVDPMTNRVTEMVRVPGTFGLAAGAGALWVGESFSSACVYRLELSELTADDSHESQK
jgi:hypothetical protein